MIQGIVGLSNSMEIEALLAKMCVKDLHSTQEKIVNC
jgi:hypothetical protein